MKTDQTMIQTGAIVAAMLGLYSLLRIPAAVDHVRHPNNAFYAYCALIGTYSGPFFLEP